jgi:predicted O-methyltransferase YrrM
MGGHFYDDPKDVLASLGLVKPSPLLMNCELYPLFFDTNSRTLTLLKLLIKDRRPNTVVETGVANGASTRQILTSFKEFNLVDSKLYSIDVDNRVGTPDLLSNPQFNLVIINSESSFLNAMKEIKSVDLFYHDSNHSYRNQMLEYEIAWEILNPRNGILISDDINWSNAFLDFCKRVNRIPLILSDGGKFSGIILKQASKS